MKRPAGKEAGNAEQILYRITLTNGNTVISYALADLGDADNNHLLCLDSVGDVQSLFFPAGHPVDPNQISTRIPALLLAEQTIEAMTKRETS